ncbi:MAG: RNA-directed DNA polymerase [Planctomycetes bacterium]|nr:RNA-directed DNA polymerase [Planctomycetota bacterium]
MDADTLADAWLSGDWTLAGMRSRTQRLIHPDRLSKSLASMILGFWLELRDRPHERRRATLAAAITAHRAFFRIARTNTYGTVLDAPKMVPPPRAWDVLPLDTPATAGAWLGLTATDATWLTDPRGIARHYDRYWSGTRLIEAPRRRLKAAQRRIAAELLAAIPPHEAAHGFRRGRSVLSAVHPHAGREVLVVADLTAFFPSVRVSRVHAMFQRVGYPEEVARFLTRMCTTRCRTLPKAEHEVTPGQAQLYRARHLPQGAPTSPALANLCAFHLDARLAGFASSLGGTYTRYADDLIFSGPAVLGRGGFLATVSTIAVEQGFRLNTAKSRVMRRSQCQLVLGMVVNEAPTLPRAQLELLEAELFRCARRGPPVHHQHGVAWLRDHLAGRVAWAKHVNPRRAQRLVELLAAIDWSGAHS